MELNADAVRDARNNAKANQIRNIQFYQNDAGKFLVEMAGQGAKVDVVLMDPPRSGSTEEFMNSVAQIGPERIVYVSCNPETLVRDLKYFKKKGYRVGRAWAWTCSRSPIRWRQSPCWSGRRSNWEVILV